MNKLSVFFCCHNRLYIDSNINEILHIDNNIIPTEINHLVSTSMTKEMIQNLDQYLYNNKLVNGLNSLANKIIAFTTLLKVAFNYKVRGKCYCHHTIPWENTYGNEITFNDQYNLFVYMFNEDSSLPPMYDLTVYKSMYRVIVHSALRTLWKFGNK
jgi:hypothetical protein